MTPQEIATRRCNLIDTGIPWRSDYAVFKCARRINSGSAYFAAARYLEALAMRETFPQAVRSLRYHIDRLNLYYRKCTSEAW